jgi:signal transduction histidine kinase
MVPLGEVAVAYVAGRSRKGWDVWPALVGVQIALFINRGLIGPGWGGWLWYVIPDQVLLMVPFLLGKRAGDRRARLAELKDRAEQLQREREQEVRLAAAVERTRITGEVHDIVAHNLAVMVALADGAAVAAPSAPERAIGTMQQVSATGREALTEMRRVLGSLRHDTPDDEADLGPQPGFIDIDALVQQVRDAGVAVTMTQRGQPSARGQALGSPSTGSSKKP